jgi:hypothetical protein
MQFCRLKFLSAVVLLAILSTACEQPAGTGTLPVTTTFEVDQTFQELFRQVDGAEMFGPAISSPFSYGQIHYQYTVACLLMRSLQAAGNVGVELAPLGLDLGVLEVAVPPPDDESLHYVDGHVIDPAFFPFYQELGGTRLVGPPLTEPRYNPKKKRIEQYFQNLGFYRFEDQPGGRVGLLAYGAWKCGQSCSSLPHPFTEAEVEPPSPVHPDLRQAVERLGLHFTGFALGPAYTTPDGTLEQIFENVILALKPGSGNRPVLRAIPADLGIVEEDPVAPSGDDEMYFYPLGENVGHNVPLSFLDYLAMHGGLDASGPPITEYNQIGEGVFRQCFSNLCLEEHRPETIPMRIRPTALGFLYWQAQNGAPGQELPLEAPPIPPANATNTPQSYPLATESVVEPAGDGVILHVWKKYPVLAAGQQQEIGAIVLQNGVPISGVQVELILSLPEADVRISMPPTGEDGQSFYLLDPIEATSGSPIDFQVCVYLQAGQATCAQDSFLIYQ